MARSISSSGTDPKTTVSEADPYTVMINSVRIRVEQRDVRDAAGDDAMFRDGRRAAAIYRDGYRSACFDILEELAVIRSKAGIVDA